MIVIINSINIIYSENIFKIQNEIIRMWPLIDTNCNCNKYIIGDMPTIKQLMLFLIQLMVNRHCTIQNKLSIYL